MKATVSVTLEDGTILTGQVTLTKDGGQLTSASTNRGQAHAPAPEGSQPDFSLPMRAFVSSLPDGLSGAKRFTLLVAHFSKGEVDVPVDRSEVIEAWNKMTGLLGGKFNGAHESRAKDGGFIYVPETGKLALFKNWRQVLS